MPKIKKNQKPIDIDAHFKYRCPSCGIDHWISLNEATTKNYKIVCDCKTILKPKRIHKIKISYIKDIESTKKDTTNPTSLDSTTLNNCVKVLVGYGFTTNEAENMIKTIFIMYPTTDCIELIKKTLESIGVNNYEQSSSVII